MFVRGYQAGTDYGTVDAYPVAVQYPSQQSGSQLTAVGRADPAHPHARGGDRGTRAHAGAKNQNFIQKHKKTKLY